MIAKPVARLEMDEMPPRLPALPGPEPAPPQSAMMHGLGLPARLANVASAVLATVFMVTILLRSGSLRGYRFRSGFDTTPHLYPGAYGLIVVNLLAWAATVSALMAPVEGPFREQLSPWLPAAITDSVAIDRQGHSRRVLIATRLATLAVVALGAVRRAVIPTT